MFEGMDLIKRVERVATFNTAVPNVTEIEEMINRLYPVTVPISVSVACRPKLQVLMHDFLRLDHRNRHN